MTQDPATASTGELLGRLSEDVSQLVRDELRLAQAEMSQKAKGAGAGAGLFGAAAVLAWFGVGALVVTIGLALALVLDGWLAAMIVTVALFVAAGVAALVGKRALARAVPPTPDRAVENLGRDARALRPGHRP